jgi:hypothetical protein
MAEADCVQEIKEGLLGLRGDAASRHCKACERVEGMLFDIWRQPA